MTHNSGECVYFKKCDAYVSIFRDGDMVISLKLDKTEIITEKPSTWKMRLEQARRGEIREDEVPFYHEKDEIF